MPGARYRELCRLVDDCPMVEDCAMDSETVVSDCPMKSWNFDEILGSHKCPECESLNVFEEAQLSKMDAQDRRDLSVYWMEHLNRHLDVQSGPERLERHGTGFRRY